MKTSEAVKIRSICGRVCGGDGYVKVTFRDGAHLCMTWKEWRAVCELSKDWIENEKANLRAAEGVDGDWKNMHGQRPA